MSIDAARLGRGRLRATSRRTQRPALNDVKALDDLSTLVGDEPSGGGASPEVLALTLVSHAVARRAGERLLLDMLSRGREVELSRNAPDFVRPGDTLGGPLADPFLSRKPLRLAPLKAGGLRLGVPEGGTRVSVAGAATSGWRDIGPDEIAAGVAIELGDRITLLLHRAAPDMPGGGGGASPLLGESAGIREVRRGIERVAGLEVPVLIRGETGTGKELVARAIHQQSPRRSARFVSVNLGAVPKELAAAELFGARRGAFTGASHDRGGFFAAAQGGTLFLDEVGEAPPEVQAMLLRVLETGEFYPVGASTPVATNARVVAATDAQLEAQISEGRFKAPLLHRLAGYDLRMPALRERREDVGPLFYHFAREQLETLGEAHRLEPESPQAGPPWLPAALAARLLTYEWPGNVRQLRNVTRQLVIDGRGEPCLRLDARLAVELTVATPAVGAPPRGRPSAPEPSAPRRKPSEVSEQELFSALETNRWDLRATAERLGISRPSLYDLIDKSPRLRTAGDLSAAEIARSFRECGGDLDEMVRRLQVSRRALARRVRELGLAATEG
jgi:two-component system, NtrC family, nitrogen regulation response regulator GlnG